jgi:hypothetical protein
MKNIDVRGCSHCYFTRLNLKKMGSLQLCLPAFIGTHWHPKQKEFLKSCEGFVKAALTGHGHPGPFWKVAKMALFNPCMKFEIFLCQITSFELLWKCHFVTLSKICIRPCPIGWLLFWKFWKSWKARPFP